MPKMPDGFYEVNELSTFVAIKTADDMEVENSDFPHDEADDNDVDAWIKNHFSTDMTTALKYSDPITGYIKVKKESMNLVNKELTQLPSSNLHQTLVIVEASAQSSENYRERVTRFIGSLNTPETIKVNVVTVTDGKLHAGLVFTGEKPGGLEIKDTGSWNMVVRVTDS